MRRSENYRVGSSRILGPIRIPINENDLEKMMKEAMTALCNVPISPPYRLEDFALLLDLFPLLSGPLSKLRPECSQTFWDIYGVWLLEKRLQRTPDMLPRWPRLPRGADKNDVKAVTFATYHRWPRVLWKDIACTGCFVQRLFNASYPHCQRHNCMEYTNKLLNNIETKKRIESTNRPLRNRSGRRNANLRRKAKNEEVSFSNELTTVTRKLTF